MKGHFNFFVGGKFTLLPQVTCVATTAGTRWSGFLIEKYYCSPQPPVGSFSCDKLHLALLTRGSTNAYWRASGVRHSVRWVPGMFALLDLGYQLGELEFDQAREMLLVDLDVCKFQRWSQHSTSVPHLLPHVLTEDLHVFGLVQQMHAEACSGCPSGQLFAKSMSLALMSYIAGRYSTEKAAPRPLPEGLSARRRLLLEEFIMSNLACDLSLEDLASLVDLESTLPMP